MTSSYLSQQELCKVNIPHISCFVVVVTELLCPLLATPWTAAHQVPLSSTISWSLLKFVSIESICFSSVQLLSCVRFFETPWTAACEASLFITNSRSLLKLMSIESVMPSNHLILCHPFLLLPSIFPSIRVFSNESVLCIKWPILEFQRQHQSFQ